MSKHKQPVLVRRVGEELLAVFPSESGSTSRDDMACFSTLDGHTACDAGYVRYDTKPVKAADIARMKRILHKLGYRDLKFVKKMTQAHHRVRRQALAARQ